VQKSESDQKPQSPQQSAPYKEQQSPLAQMQQQQHQYQERKPYELQPQPPQPPPQQYQPQDYPRAAPIASPVVVHDHKHQQEVFNANVDVSAPQPTISSMSSTLANLNLGEAGDQYQPKPPAVLTSSTVTTSSGTYPMPATLPVTQIGSQPYYSDNTNPYSASYAYPPTNYNQTNYNMPDVNSDVNRVPSFPSQSFTTPISLPGMPPLTVSATLPTDKFSLPLSSNYQSHTFNPPSNQPLNYQVDPHNQSYSPQI